MPKISQVSELYISPEKFLNACTPLELNELEILLMSPRFQIKMKGYENGTAVVVDEVPALTSTGKYYCSVCGKVPVDVDNGIDTCDKCLYAI